MRKDCWIRGEGPLVPLAEAFRFVLREVGHPAVVVKKHLVLMGQLNRWLAAKSIGAEALTAGLAQEFLNDRRASGTPQVPTLVTLKPLFDCLRRQHAIAPEPPTEPTPLEELLDRYRRHLVKDRGLTATTVRRYDNFARRFLAERARRSGTPTGVEGLASAEVNAYLLEAASRLSIESAKREAADLRALLRYLYVAGMLEADLGTAMPPVAAWRGTA
ncbi:MAG: tyrosine-type recombinase/integrase, partial [Actinomycetota bacterium]